MAKKVEFNLDVVKKYLFWVCTPIGLVVAVAAGLIAIGSVASDLEQQKQQLESQRTSMEQLRARAATHPNQGTIDAINQEREILATNVLAAWDILEREQRTRNLWTGLADVAIREIERANFLDELTGTTRQNYLRFAQDAINNLLDRPAEEFDIRRVEPRRLREGQWVPVDPVQLAESRGVGGMGMGMGMGGATGARTTPPMPGDRLMGKVVWNSPNLNFTMADWRGQQPQAFEVWLTQEDLWVYQALLWVIAESNRNVREASRPIVPGTAAGSGAGTGAGGEPLNLRDSVVKEIIDLAIGQRAAAQLARQASRRIGGGGMGMGGDGMMGGMGMGGGGMMGGMGMGSGGMMGGMGMGGGGMMGSMGMGGGGFGGDSGGGFGSSDMGMGGTGMTAAAMAEQARRMAMMGRYVDADGTPLMEPDLSGQFRRMPVYLQLRVDQRFISDILVNCANCPMPIDVLWVTVNPSATQSFDFVSATGAGALSGFGGSGGSGLSGGGAMSSRFPGGGGGGAMSSRFPSGGGSGGIGGAGAVGNVDFGPHEVIVEIFGCINIFAPPDPQTIGGESGMAGSF